MKYVFYSYRKLEFMNIMYIYIVKILDNILLFVCTQFQFSNILKACIKISLMLKKF